ncbi:MAG TPA: adenylyl-sulfate kinase [Bacteroidia bacterium]|nr:adenylyl-sulfate kinase [Bacteroidia bacterium]
MDTKNIIRQDYKISKKDRVRLNGHKPLIVWFTGLSGSGKSTLAGQVEEHLYEMGVRTYLLDGDNIRHGLNNNVDFSEEGRKENIRRIGEVAKLFADAGIVVLTAFISPFRADRDQVRFLVETGEFTEIFVNCPIEICEQRDVKGLYKKARAGEISDFTGISSPFENPVKPEMEIKTDVMSVEESVDAIVKYITKKIK